MKKHSLFVLYFLICICFGVLCSCSKKDSPEPQAVLPEYSFRGTLDGEPLEFTRDLTNNNIECNTASFGSFYHNNKNDQYDYNFKGGANWTVFKNKNTSYDYEKMLDIRYDSFVYNVNMNYDPSDIQHYSLLKSRKIIYHNYPYSPSDSTGGWLISYIDSSQKSWISTDQNSGNIIINSTVKKDNNGRNYAQIDGYLYCNLYNDQNQSKILEGNFRYLVTEYFHGGVYEYNY